MKQGSFLSAIACALVFTSSSVFAQLPVTQLTSIFPPGGKQGSTVEVTIAGADMDEVEQLILDHAGLGATPKLTAATPLEPARSTPNQFVVTIGSDVLPGIYEVRAMGRFGL